MRWRAQKHCPAAGAVDGAKMFPVERVIPDDMKQKIDEYLNRDRPKEA